MAQYENTLLLDSRDTDPVYTGNGYAAARGNKYGEQAVALTDRGFYAREGSLFSACNTPGTGITMQASVTALDATKPSLVIRNNRVAGSHQKVIPIGLKLFATTVPGGSGFQRWEMRLDPGTNRYTSGGSTLTGVNLNGASSAQSSAVIKMGAITAPAASANERLLSHGIARNGVGLAGDTWYFDFTGNLGFANCLDEATTAGATSSFSVPPCVLGAQDSLLLHWYGASLSTAAVWEAELIYVER